MNFVVFLDKVCLLGCGIFIGYGVVFNIVKVRLGVVEMLIVNVRLGVV